MTEFLTPLMEIAKDAGNEILKIYGQTSFQVDQKSDDSPLTQADTAANKIICDALEKLAPSIPIISEENKQIPYETRKEYTRFWLVDPLDGTKEFVKRNGEFTVNIALIENGSPILSVVYVPVTEEMYYASKGNGAFVKSPKETKRLVACPFIEEESHLQVVCSRSHLNNDTADFIKKYNNIQQVAKGSSLKFLILASGDAHIYPRLAPTMEWDTAAAQIILEESGGKVIDWNTKQPLQYNKKVLTNPHFVAYGNLIT